MPNSLIGDWIEQAKQVAASGQNSDNSMTLRQTKPVAAIITAADFAIDPYQLTGAAPGSFYEIRNAAGLVPPGAGDGMDYSVGADLEFAIQFYCVEHIIVLVGPNCGLLNCLLNEDAEGIAAIVDGQYLPNWTQLTASAIYRVGST